jgi:hypothetical protein
MVSFVAQEELNIQRRTLCILELSHTAQPIAHEALSSPENFQ